MPDLRAALSDAGCANVRTYVQSGNVVLDSDLSAVKLAAAIGDLLAADFGLKIQLVTRTRDELAKVIAANPLAEAVNDPKRYQISFLSEPLAEETVARLSSLAAPPERLVVAGREVFAWHPEGVARSKLSNALAGRLGVVATARNWTTVNAILELADVG